MKINDKETELCNLLYKYHSDKCPRILHTYSPYYFELLKPIQRDVKNLLEIGVGNNSLMSPLVGAKYTAGASLRAWRDFFPNACIFSIDIQREVLFEEDRIKCFYADQSCLKSLRKFISLLKEDSKQPDLLFDIIIDDGSHVLNHARNSLIALYPYLRTGGFYIIEDIKNTEIHLWLKCLPMYGRLIKVHIGNEPQDSFVVIQKVEMNEKLLQSVKRHVLQISSSFR